MITFVPTTINNYPTYLCIIIKIYRTYIISKRAIYIVILLIHQCIAPLQLIDFNVNIYK